MWKEYSYDQLKGVIKVGDRVKAVEGKHNNCGKLEDEGSNEVEITEVSETHFYIDGCSHVYEEGSFLARWEGPKTLDDVKVGDVFITQNGNTRKVLGRCGDILFLSKLNENDVSQKDTWWTVSDIQKDFTVQPEEKETVELTLQEVADKIGVDVSVLRIKE
ncbi:hypothetical protein COW46_00765 [Candidatus Gracilibacteria bacterium CG17_big_fil_post_rev_8_21_14_2_50_48_13]|nr:MAG: hypothetical protein COW46_00765 [Candidatus Gracilibacteria bacterium CG17_big_fil_post_rev_8_21_14_2_50_48_13]